MSPPRDDDPPSSDDGSEGTDRTQTDGTDAVESDDRAPESRRPDAPTPDDENDGSAPSSESVPTSDRERTADASGRATDTPERTADGPPGAPDRGTPDGRSRDRQSGRRAGGSGSGPGPGERGSEGVPSAAPPARRADEDDEENWVRAVVFDVTSSALAVLLVGFFLFTVSGVWPPMVAVESASMTPQMKTGDLVFVMEEDRFPGEGAHGETGVVTARSGAASGYEKFSRAGDVVVYEPNGNGEQTPIIHRAMFWVEKDERWYDRADKGAISGADSCEEMANCPAPHAGFVTKGDANGAYDQVGPSPHSGPVKPEWIVGTAEERVPGLGCIRLRSQDCSIALSAAPGLDLGIPAVGFHVDPSAMFDLVDEVTLAVPETTVTDALV